MKVAALDLGTNSFLCLVAEVESGIIKQVYSDQVEIVRLGQDVQKSKSFRPDALERARLCLERFKQTIDLHKPEKVLAMATSAARDVSNAFELISIGKNLGIPIQIIPGEREAEITYKGATSGLPQDKKRRAVIDIGGGSTELIAGAQGKILGGESVNIGAVRLTELCFPTQPPTKSQIQSLKSYAEEKLEHLLKSIRNFQVDELIAVAGTPTELAAAAIGQFDPKRIDGFQMNQQDLEDWCRKFAENSAKQRVQKFGISPGRADIILAGALILEMILKGLGFQSLTVSTRGVRYGIALEMENSSSFNSTSQF